MSLDDLLAQTPTAAQTVTRKAPAGWEPGYTYDSTTGTGTVTTQALDTEPDTGVWAELIADWGLNPATHQVVPGSVQVRGWDAPVGGGEVRRLRYYKATIVDRVVQTADVAEVIAAACRKGPLKRDPVTTDHPAFVVSLNDWQLGKAGPDGSSVATMTFLSAAWAAVLARLKELEKLGRRPSQVILANTGDLIEGVAGHYASQTFTVDLNGREQLRVARRLVFRMVDDLVSRNYPVVVTAVPCNHGENRNGAGKAQTTPDDNASLTIIEGVEEACAANEDRYGGRVSFAYAKDLTLVLDINGVNVGLTHGHQIRGSGSTAAKVEKWWQGQIMGNQPIAAADMLLTAHLHHLQVSEETGRLVIVAPAADGGSYWYSSATGRNSRRGMLTLTVGDGHDRGWGDLHVC